MKINTLYLPGFSHRLCGRRADSSASKLSARALKLDGLAALIAKFIPMGVFAEVGERDRTFTPWITFCAFLGQVLQRGASCRDAVRRVQAWHLAIGSGRTVDDATGGYCQARKRLPLDVLCSAFNKLVARLDQRSREQDRWLGHIVKVIDGGGISMPDTPANRKEYPYAGGQRKGCGFPTGQMVGLFSLATGHLVKYVISSWKVSETPLARQLVGWVHRGEVLLADRGFCNWIYISLLYRKGVDVVMRLHHARKTGTGRVCWKKPPCRPEWEKALWLELPMELALRVVRFRVEIPGFRTTQIAVVTTLLDETKYPDSAICELYLRRWQVELHFRDIKTALGLDVLRTNSPKMIEKEVQLQAIAYNLVRLLMLEAARQHDVPPMRLSFQGTISTLRAFAPLLATTAAEASQHFEDLLLAIAADPVPLRPNRSEPRAVKRRPKPYQRLTRPRHKMRVSISRRQK